MQLSNKFELNKLRHINYQQLIILLQWCICGHEQLSFSFVVAVQMWTENRLADRLVMNGMER